MNHATQRLHLCWPQLSDAENLLALLGDAENRPHTFVLADITEAREHIEGHERQRSVLGYGPWIVLEKSSGRMIGFGGLYDDLFDPGWGMEIGYHFMPEVWGRGFASELTRYSLDFAYRAHEAERVRAFAHPDNPASRKVLTKAGFREERYVPEMDRILFVHTPAAR